MKKYISILLLMAMLLDSIFVSELNAYAMSGAQYSDMHTIDIVAEVKNGDVLSKFPCLGEDFRVSDVKVLTDLADYCFVSAQITYDANIYTERDVLNLLNETKGVICAEKDMTLRKDASLWPNISNDKNMSLQWYLDTIGATKTWDLFENTIPGEGTVVAVIDTGVDYSHEDLVDNIWINEAEQNGIFGIDDDNNGVTDDVYGANFSAETTENGAKSGEGINSRNREEPDPDGHGTHVAGIIAMSKGNGGGRGIAYGSRIMSVRAGGAEGSFKLSAVVSAMDYAVQMGADVINMSFGTYTESAILKSMIEKASKDCVLVAAAGNDGYVTSDYICDKTCDVYPAAYPQVIGVMATDTSSNVTAWSNYDYTPYTTSEYEIAAPGYKIYSTAPNGKYAYMNGTSMATPMVSAAAAILLGAVDTTKVDNPADFVRAQIIEATSERAKLTDSTGVVHNYPLLNIYEAITTNASVNMHLGSFDYYEQGKGRFEDTITVEKGKTTEVFCGFRVCNLWKKTSDIEVNMKIDSGNVECINDVLKISNMKEREFLDVSYRYAEAFAFKYKADVAGTYVIPVKYTVSASTADGTDNYVKEFSHNIIVNVTEPVPVSAGNIQNSGVAVSPADDSRNGKETADKSASVVLGRVKGLKAKKKKVGNKRKITLTWKAVSGAKKYAVYYSYKKNGKYRKLTLTKKRKFTHILKKKKNCYYKVRAYSNSNGNSVYGKYSVRIKVKY
ncbi:MAG: hypothetical protein E7265_03905 [Lachnospiraceae bacterium]|nr:hypothetical protein [Lachnospiraceae bacterium]